MTDSSEDNKKTFTVSIELIVRCAVSLFLAIFIVCGTMINKNSIYGALLLRTIIVKTLFFIGLLAAGCFFPYIPAIVIFVLTFLLYWQAHGIRINTNRLSDRDKKRLKEINDFEKKFNGSNVILDDDLENQIGEREEETNEEIEREINGEIVIDNHNIDINEETPLMNNNTIEKGKDLLNDVLSVASNYTGRKIDMKNAMDIVKKANEGKLDAMSIISNASKIINNINSRVNDKINDYSIVSNHSDNSNNKSITSNNKSIVSKSKMPKANSNTFKALSQSARSLKSSSRTSCCPRVEGNKIKRPRHNSNGTINENIDERIHNLELQVNQVKQEKLNQLMKQREQLENEIEQNKIEQNEIEQTNDYYDEDGVIEI